MSKHGASQLSPILNKKSINKNFISLRFDEIIVSFCLKYATWEYRICSCHHTYLNVMLT